LFFKPNIEKLKRKKDIGKLVEAMGYKKSAYLQRDAAEALAELGESGFSSLVEALASDNRDVVYYAVHGLGKMADGRAVEPLIDLMTRIKEWEQGGIVPDNVGWKAAHVIGKIGSQSTILLLADAISTGKNIEMILLAVETLGRVSVPTLITLSRIDRDERSKTRSKEFITTMRTGAVGALGRLGDERGIPHLVELMGDEESDIREAAVEALEIMGERAVPTLAEALRDDDHRTRANAVKALALIQRKKAAPAINGLLKDIDLSVIYKVAKTLRWIGGKDSIEHLRAARSRIGGLTGADKSSVLWKNEPVSAEDEPTFKKRKRTELVMDQIGNTIGILKGEKTGGFWGTFEKYLYMDDYRKADRKMAEWDLRMKIADKVEAMDIEEEMAEYFSELKKRKPKIYDLFEDGLSEMDSHIMYRMTGESEYID